MWPRGRLLCIRGCEYDLALWKRSILTYQPPATGLGAARMAALLTYRSRDSFESRFGRNTLDPLRQQNINALVRPNTDTSANEHFAIHNEGHKRAGSSRLSMTRQSSLSSTPTSPIIANTIHDQQSGDVTVTVTDPQFHGATPLQSSISFNPRKKASTYFSAQSYLRYQGEKFIKRFDANCYIAITRKLDTHDLSRHCEDPESEDPLKDALAQIEQPALVLGIESDGLFTYGEQQEIAHGIPNARLEKIDSSEGHDAFLLQFEQVNQYILGFLHEALPDIMSRTPQTDQLSGDVAEAVGIMTKTSTFGEAEVEDITAW